MNNTILGCGSLDAKLMLIGEAPGKDELLLGEPFVGRSGKLLDILLAEGQLSRSDCYITNVSKEASREGNKNVPLSTTLIDRWKPVLWQELKSSKAKLIITLGKVPTGLLLKFPKTFKMSEKIGKRYTVDWHTAYIIPCLHPSFILQYGRQYTEDAKDLFRKIGKIINDTNK